MKEGTVSAPHSAPCVYVLPVRGLSYLRGATAAGVKPLLSVQIVIDQLN